MLQKLLLFRKRTSCGKTHSPGWRLQCVIAVVSDFRGEGLVYTSSCTQDKPPSLKASSLLSPFVSWRRPSCPVIAGVWGLLGSKSDIELALIWRLQTALLAVPSKILVAKENSHCQAQNKSVLNVLLTSPLWWLHHRTGNKTCNILGLVSFD